MTAAQIKTIAAETESLLELTLPDGPLDATTQPITIAEGNRGMVVTLHACQRNSGDDVVITATIDRDGNVDSYHAQAWSWSDQGMSPLELINGPAQYLETQLGLTF